MNPEQLLPIVVLISGRGSNLQSIIDDTQAGTLPIEIRAVISNRADAAGLERARRANIPTAVLDHRQFADRASFDRALIKLIDGYAPKLVILAGFMRILSPIFVSHFYGRTFNIHPSLLPRFQGLHTHRRALQAGEREHGASIHFVTDDLDGGPVVVQARVPVLPDDDEERLAKRVLEKEHVIYPLAIRWFADGRVRMEDDRVIFDGEPLSAPRVL